MGFGVDTVGCGVGWGGRLQNNHKDYVGYLCVHETSNILHNYVGPHKPIEGIRSYHLRTYIEVNLKPMPPVWCLPWNSLSEL